MNHIFTGESCALLLNAKVPICDFSRSCARVGKSIQPFVITLSSKIDAPDYLSSPSIALKGSSLLVLLRKLEKILFAGCIQVHEHTNVPIIRKRQSLVVHFCLNGWYNTTVNNYDCHNVQCQIQLNTCAFHCMSPNPGASTPMTLEKVYDAFLTQAMETASLVTSLA